MERKRKRLPIGIDNFDKIVREEFYYVDKTGIIKDLLEHWSEVNLFTRPRRFGKSLNIAMLKSFFEIGADSRLFEDLEIWKSRDLCEGHMGKYPVISISLKDVDGHDYDTAYTSLRLVVCEEIRRIAELSGLADSEHLSVIDKSKLDDFMWERFENESELTNALKVMCNFLYKHYGRNVIVLIDEYDVPLDKAYHNGYYDRMLDTIRALLSKMLKSNPNLHFAVLTGCLRIARESIFTGLYNFKVMSISDTEFAGYFGFTDFEVRELRTDRGAAPASYWINSSNSIIADRFEKILLKNF